MDFHTDTGLFYFSAWWGDKLRFTVKVSEVELLLYRDFILFERRLIQHIHMGMKVINVQLD